MIFYAIFGVSSIFRDLHILEKVLETCDINEMGSEHEWTFKIPKMGTTLSMTAGRSVLGSSFLAFVDSEKLRKHFESDMAKLEEADRQIGRSTIDSEYP